MIKIIIWFAVGVNIGYIIGALMAIQKRHEETENDDRS